MGRFWSVLGVVVVVLGCTSSTIRRDHAEAAPAQAFDDGWRPGPAPQRSVAAGKREADNAACVGCHREIAEEWAGSLHAGSYLNAVFSRAIALEPAPFCRSCHAPESPPERAPSAEHAALGVACVTCHGTLGAVWSSSSSEPKGAPHTVRTAAWFGTAEACAACHEFSFPLRPRALMQSTVSEHERSSFANIGCRDCHMPEVVEASGRRHRRHDFRVQGDAAFMAQAVTVSAERAGDYGVRITLAADRVGHAVPTGDIFRRLELRGEALDDQGRTLEVAPAVVFTRSFAVEQGPNGLDRRPIADTRLPPPGWGSVDAGLHFKTNLQRARVRWRLVYLRMSTAMYDAFGFDAETDAVVLASGEISAADREPRTGLDR